MSALLFDLHYAWRRLIASPVFFAFSVVTLAMGVGASTAMSAMIEGIVYRSAGVKDPADLVNIYSWHPPQHQLTRAEVDAVMSEQTVFQGVVPWTRFVASAEIGSRSSTLLGEMVGGDYFDVLGVEPEIGRLFRRSDDTPMAPLVTVISDSTWRVEFGGAQSVLGKSMRMAGSQFTIVGVVPDSFRGLEMSNVMPVPVWATTRAASIFFPARALEPNVPAFFVKARLSHGVSLETADAQVASLWRACCFGETETRPFYVQSAARVHLSPASDRVAIPLARLSQIGVLLALMVVLGNLTSLMSARLSERRLANGLQLALGASRARLFQQTFSEMLLITAVAAPMALVVAFALDRQLTRAIPLGFGLSVYLAPLFNGEVLGQWLGAILTSILLCGVWPAARGLRPDLWRWRLREQGLLSRRSLTVHRVTTCLQVGVSVALLLAATEFTSKLLSLTRHDSGLTLSRITFVEVNGSNYGDGRTGVERTLRAAASRLSRLPHVLAAALATTLPIGNQAVPAEGAASLDTTAGGATGVVAVASDPALLQMLGVRITEGRLLTLGDRGRVLLSQDTAQRLFAGVDPIGKRVRLTERASVGHDTAPTDAEVIGVTTNTDARVFGSRVDGVAYLSLADSDHWPGLVIETDGQLPNVIAVATRAITDADDRLPVLDARTGADLADSDALSALRLGSTIALGLGLLTFGIAMFGLYVILTHVVLSRRREIAIRSALGASSRNLVVFIVAGGARLLTLGVIGGLLFGWEMETLLGMFKPFDFLASSTGSLYVVFTLSVGTGLLACFLPARRVAQGNPADALRDP